MDKLDGIQKRIRTVETDIEKLDQVDMVVLLDVGGHVILDLSTADRKLLQDVKMFIKERFAQEVESLQRIQTWSNLIPKEASGQ